MSFPSSRRFLMVFLPAVRPPGQRPPAPTVGLAKNVAERAVRAHHLAYFFFFCFLPPLPAAVLPHATQQSQSRQVSQW